MDFNISTLLPVMPEIFLLTATCVILVIDLFLSQQSRIFTYGLALGTLLATIAVVVAVGGGDSQTLLHGAYIRDPMGDLLKVALLVVASSATSSRASSTCWPCWHCWA